MIHSFAAAMSNELLLHNATASSSATSSATNATLNVTAAAAAAAAAAATTAAGGGGGGATTLNLNLNLNLDLDLSLLPDLQNSSPGRTPDFSHPGGPTLLGAAVVSPWDIALCVTGTLIACENALVIAILFYTPALRAPMFILIGSLAVADMLAGLGLILNFVFVYILNTEVATLVSAAMLIAAFSASVLNILAITVDRYLSLYNALTYHTDRTVTFTYLMVALIWLVSLTLGLLPAMGWNCLGADDGEDEASSASSSASSSTCSVCRPVTKSNAVALAVAFLLVLALMTQLYLQICRIALRHAQQIAVQHQHGFSAAISTSKGVCTLSAILCAFAACWVPLAAYAIVADASYPAAYTYAAALPATANSVFNPIIYAFRNPDIQKSLWLACCGCVPTNLSLRPRASSDV